MLRDKFPEEMEEKLQIVIEEAKGEIDDAVERLLCPDHYEVEATYSKYFEAGPSSRHDDFEAGPSSRHDDFEAGPSSRHDDFEARPSSHLDDDSTLRDLLSAHQAKFTDFSRFSELEISRERVWRQAMSFYKNSCHRPERLRHELCIEFIGEEGIDAGALRCEFFEQVLKELDQKLFEGNPQRRVPKKDEGLEHTFKIAGIIIAHSILQGGPAFPCLCPPVYSYLVFADRDKALQELPSKNDIPHNMGTDDLLDLIEGVCSVNIHKLVL